MEKQQSIPIWLQASTRNATTKCVNNNCANGTDKETTTPNDVLQSKEKMKLLNPPNRWRNLIALKTPMFVGGFVVVIVELQRKLCMHQRCIWGSGQAHLIRNNIIYLYCLSICRYIGPYVGTAFLSDFYLCLFLFFVL